MGDGNCATCHSLGDANSKGKVGPNLNEIKPDISRVLMAVKNGIGVMPAYQGQLSDEEIEAIGEQNERGVLPVRTIGATVRMTKDRRILIRNTAEVYDPLKMSQSELDKRSIKQRIGIKKRFPQLPDSIIQSSWSGIVSRTRNSSQIFEKIDDNIFVAGCYNGSGIGVGTLFGEQIAIKASNEHTKEIEIIEARNKPTWLPPQPFLNFGIKTRLIYERIRARSDI